jgi:hypothetical protein
MFCFTYDLMRKAMQGREVNAQAIGFAAVAAILGLLMVLSMCLT